jgi:hypothetical protein
LFSNTNVTKLTFDALGSKTQAKPIDGVGLPMGIVERCFIASAVIGLLLLVGIGFLPV